MASSLHYVVIGGGVAGIACVQELSAIDAKAKITLVSASTTVKGIENYVKLSDALETFDVVDKSIKWLSDTYPNVTVLTGIASNICPAKKRVHLQDGTALHFDKLCICTGAVPKTVGSHPFILGLRDSESAVALALKLREARRVAVVGNGGIALGLIHEMTKVEVVWAVKDAYIGNTFFDASASLFLLKAHQQRFRVVGGVQEEQQHVPAEEAEDGGLGAAEPSASTASAALLSGSKQRRGEAEGATIAAQAAEETVRASTEAAREEAGLGYKPLPQRQGGRKKARGKAGEVAESSVAGGAAGSGTEAAAAVAAGAASLSHSSAAQPLGAAGAAAALSPPAVTPYGSSLGPSWIQVIRKLQEGEGKEGDRKEAAGGTVSAQEAAGGVDSPSEMMVEDTPAAHPSASSSSSSASSTPAADSQLSPVWLHRGVELLAVRAGSASAQQGFLADGQWHELSAGNPSLSESALQERLAAEGRQLSWWMSGQEQQHSSSAAAAAAVAPAAEEADKASWPLHVLLSNGCAFGCDFMVSATGVQPLLPAIVEDEGRAALAAASPASLLQPCTEQQALSLPLTVHAMQEAGLAELALDSAPSSSSSSFSSKGTPAAAGALSQQPCVVAPLALTPGRFLVYPDGGLLVNQLLQTTGSPDIYAAGDSAAVVWPRQVEPEGEEKGKELQEEGEGKDADSEQTPCLWFQMRLWQQARIQGSYAARSMTGTLDSLELLEGGFSFELFAHMTRFLGKKVVLLGLYNGQGLGKEYEQELKHQLVTEQGLLRAAAGGSGAAAGAAGAGQAMTSLSKASRVQVQLRVTPGEEYVKIVLLDGKVVGAMLIGETDMEETLENLILNRLPLRLDSGRDLLDLLDPDVDIEDYFD